MKGLNGSALAGHLQQKNSPLNQYPGSFQAAPYIQPYHFFHTLNGTIPSVYSFHRVKRKKLLNAIIKEFNLPADAYAVYRSEHDEKPEIIEAILVIDDSLIVYFTHLYYRGNAVKILYRNNSDKVQLEQLKKLIRKQKRAAKSKGEINLICQDNGMLDVRSFPISTMDIDLPMHYNEDFLPVNAIIEDQIKADKKHGLILLHGQPGTGKTSYLRHLISKYSNKIIFLPPDMSAALSNPDFLSLLTHHQDSVLIIEDAENALSERTSTSNGAVANILNLGDGLLADCLNILVICTFNQPVKKIDQALLRKGRLLAKYEFQTLSIPKAQALCDKLGKDYVVNEPMSVAEIYNLEQPSFTEPEKTKVIGF